MWSRPATSAFPGILLVILILAMCAAPAGAVTWGQKDTAGQYRNVGTFLVSVPSEGAVYQACSGTLIHPKVFLTAGHCTVNLPDYLASGLIDKIYVSFDFDPFAQSHHWLEVDSVITHPDFSFHPQSNWHDNGVLILKDAVDGIQPAGLPEEGFLDRLRAEGALGHGTNGAKFTVVGYGASLSFPPPRQYSDDVRQFAISEFRALLPAWLRMSQQRQTGDSGTCYGDSGGPTFWEEPGGVRILVATTSWGDVPCVSSEFNQRIDVASSLSFIQAVIDSLP
jgi:secreted trypsin-like serine protease